MLKLNIQHFAAGDSGKIGIEITLNASTFNTNLAKLRKQITAFQAHINEIKLNENFEDSVSDINDALESSEEQLKLYKTALKEVQRELRAVKKAHEDGEISTNEWEKQTTSLIVTQQSYKKNIAATNKAIKEYDDMIKSAGGGIKTFVGKLKTQETQLLKIDKKFNESVKHLGNWEETTQGLRKKISSLNSVLGVHEKKLEILQTEYKRVDSISGYSKEKKDELIKSINKEYDALEKTRKELGKYTKSLDDPKRKLKEVSDRIKELNERLEEEIKAHGKNSKEVKKLKSDLKGLANEYDALETEINGVDEAQDRANAGWSMGKQILADLARNAIQNVVNGLNNMVRASWDASVSFESAFANVRKTVDATDEELAKMEQQVIELSKEIPATANEISDVAAIAGQLGIDTDNIVEFSKTMINLGVAIDNVDATQAATDLAKFANVTKMNQKDFEKLGSVITALGNDSAAAEKDIIDMATRIASTGEIVGLSEAQIFGLATSLSAVGVEAEAGGTAISKLLKNMNVSYSTFDKSQEMIGKTGMSLRDLQLLASNNSSDFKKLTDSLGMTQAELKTAMKTVQTYNDYAKTAGKTTEEFAKIYEKDAVEALSLFIEGLQDTERNGKNAVEILQEMGLTEVRLSNAVLALSTAQSGINKNVKLANKAWEENVALANEANRRYETTESKLKMLGNSFSALSITMFKEFKEPMVEAFSGLQNEIEGMTDDLTGDGSLRTAIREMGASVGKMAVSLLKSLRTLLPSLLELVTASAKLGEKILPTISKILTKVVNIAMKLATYLAENEELIYGIVTGLAAFKLSLTLSNSKIIKFIASLKLFSKATGTATTATVAATGAQKGLLATLGINPYVLAAAAIVGFGVALFSYVKKAGEASDKTKELAEETENLIEATSKERKEYEATAKAREENVNAINSEINYTRDLWEELQTIVDANGKIKKGYEGRAKFIVDTINEALGLEIEIVDGQIKKYKELEDQVDKVVEKKRAQLILDAREEEYKEALLKQNTALDEQNKLKDQKSTIQKQLDENLSALNEYFTKVEEMQELERMGLLQAGSTWGYQLSKHGWLKDMMATQDSLKEQIEQVEGELTANEQAYHKYYETIKSYEEDYANFTQGNYDKISGINTEYTNKTNEEWNKRKETINKDIAKNQVYVDTIISSFNKLSKEEQKVQASRVKAEIKRLEDQKKTYEQELNTLSGKEKQEMEIIIAGINQRINQAKYGTESVRAIYLESYSQQITDALGKQVEFRDVGNGLVQAIVDGVEIGKPFATEKMDTVVKEMNSKISSEDNLTDTKNKTGEIIGAIEQEALEKQKQVQELGGKIGQWISKYIDKDENGVNRGEKPASNILSGITNTLSSKGTLGKIAAVGIAIGKAIIGGINSGTDSHSPSKKAIQSMKNVMDGLKVGLEKDEDSLYREVESFGDTLTGRLQNSLGQVKSNISGSVSLGTAGSGSGANGGNISNSKVVNWTQNYTMPKSMSRTDMYLENKRLKSQILTELNANS